MDVIPGFPDPADRPPLALALGNFDGVHRGHQALLRQALDAAAKNEITSAVCVFDPHPRRYFRPDGAPFRLMSDARRASLLDAMGFDRLHVLTFDAAMVARSPAAFVAEVLHGGLNVSAIFVGGDFRFGKDRKGDFASLEQLAAKSGMSAFAADLVEAGDGKISSSQIREAVARGDMASAADLLGRPWILDGEVEMGDQRGRTIGFPTANVALSDFVRPAHGVYAVTAQLPGHGPSLAGVANVGVRPTVDGLNERLEVHLFEFDGDIYKESLAVSFHDRIRGEQKFDGLDSLKAQIARDCDRAKSILAARKSGPA